MDEARRTKKNLWMFPLGTVGRDMIYTLFTNFILTYILFTRSLTAAQLSAITAIMVAARVFDALNDPIMGNIIERTRSRYGKFKPWLLIGILLTSAVVYAAFNTRLEGWGFVAFLRLHISDVFHRLHHARCFLLGHGGGAWARTRIPATASHPG